MFWVNPLGQNFGHIRVSDLVLVDDQGRVVHGRSRINAAAFAIHSALHAARPDVVAAAHSHSLYGKAFSTLGRLLDPITQDACSFYGQQALFDDYTGVVLDPAEDWPHRRRLPTLSAAGLSWSSCATTDCSRPERAWTPPPGGSSPPTVRPTPSCWPKRRASRSSSTRPSPPGSGRAPSRSLRWTADNRAQPGRHRAGAARPARLRIGPWQATRSRRKWRPTIPTPGSTTCAPGLIPHGRDDPDVGHAYRRWPPSPDAPWGRPSCGWDRRTCDRRRPRAITITARRRRRSTSCPAIPCSSSSRTTKRFASRPSPATHVVVPPCGYPPRGKSVARHRSGRGDRPQHPGRDRRQPAEPAGLGACPAGLPAPLGRYLPGPGAVEPVAVRPSRSRRG